MTTAQSDVPVYLPERVAARADVVHREALRIWWAREARLPRFTRRAPDALDVATGALGRVVAEAERALAERGVRPTEATG